MKMNKTHTLAGILVLVGLLAGTTALAKGPGGCSHGEHRPHHDPVELVSELGASDAVIEQVKALHRASRDATLELRFKLDKARNTLKDLLDADAPGESSVMAQVETAGALKTQLKKARLRTMLKIKALLTPEQRKKFRELKRKKRAKRKGRGGKGRPGAKD